MADYDPNECMRQLTAGGFTPVCDKLVNPHHCDDNVQQSQVYHASCTGARMYAPVQASVCRNSQTGEVKYWPKADTSKNCFALYKQDQNWELLDCYCCCSCFANDTLIGVPGGSVEIFTIPVGGVVLAASVKSEGGSLTVAWSEQEVGFSAGTGANGVQAAMVYMVYGREGADHEVVCTMDQPFLLANGKLTTAGKLRPGQQLVDKEGNAVPVRLVSVGSYEGGVHHIATRVPWTGSIDNHLILAGGVVAGDYSLQAYFQNLDAALKELDHDRLPLLGTPEYESQLATDIQRAEAVLQFAVVAERPLLRATASAQGNTENGDTEVSAPVHKLSRGRFVAYRRVASYFASQGHGRLLTAAAAVEAPRVVDPSVPAGARALLTPEQVSEVIKNGSQTSLGLNIEGPRYWMEIVTKQVAGFYPDVHVYYDELNFVPNVYAFEAYGKKIVQVNGGFARLMGMVYEGLLMAVAYGMGAFYAGEPATHGLSAVGKSDWYAFALASGNLWQGAGVRTKLVLAAVQQWQKLFDLVENPAAAAGNPQNVLDDPSLNCRMDNIWSASGRGPFLECVGGPVQPKLDLQSADAKSAKSVELVFSIEVNPEQAKDPSNYELEPKVPISKATRHEDRRFRVTLELGGELQSGTSYTVVVSNLTSYSGDALNADADSATFVYKAPDGCG
jgi:hypothetical protein